MDSNKLKISIASFKKSAFIIMENQRDSHNFFIILEGKVKTSMEMETGTGKILGPGDFFGVISCMSSQRREVTAQALSDTVLILVSKEQFGSLIQTNPIIPMKIIRLFSSQLRQMDEMMIKAHHSGNFSEQNDHHQKLFQLGSFYQKNNEPTKASYVYKKYLEVYSEDKHAEECQQQLTSLQSLLPKTDELDDDDEIETTGGIPIKTYRNNDIIFCEHEMGKTLYIIKTGQVKISKLMTNYEKTIAILKAGDIFGEMALLENEARNATATALDVVKLMAINQNNFEQMVSQEPQLVTKMITVLSERIWISFRQLENNSFKNPGTKILNALLLQVEKDKIPITRHNHAFDFGVKELIEMVGLDMEQGQKAINFFLKKKFLVIKENQKLMALNLEMLKKEFQFIRNKEVRETIIAHKKTANELPRNEKKSIRGTT